MLYKDKIILITGASQGIGKAVAKAFIKEGAHVLIVARTLSKLEEIDDYAKKLGSNTTIIPLDITDFLKIDELSRIIALKFGKIDVLIGNAAEFDKLIPITHVENDSWQKIIDTNLTANWRLLKAMEALLRNSDNPRILFTISQIKEAYWGVYAISQSALKTMVEIYSKEVTIKNIRVNLIDPGEVDTSIRMKSTPGEDKSKIKKPEDIVELFLKLASINCQETGKTFTNL